MDPFKNWQDWRKNLDAFFGENFLSSFENILLYNYFPQVNVYKTDNELIVLANIPGLNDINNVDVFIDYQSLELRGNVNLKYKGFKLIQDELFNGHFERKINLPYPVKEDRIDATYQNGLLIIHLHRLIPDDHRRHKIEIKKIEE
ncbi:Hsp20/alpha crystallin family protein [Calidifontibacillus erzurumensis]|uniref:Hsp20/alpha crystallin family protein n=1 Tax=Calidifontibacillus erzurumensis TaxID=2741433 RepID=A0A8J8KFK1_9BACI|nr:Hsp20/alpha crystallin family protein [Calidifontibacillus erzurumensis]NSL53005.1 Hsp20/alpha crystallin family protein [Calidifontibacillus erzurumensis]